MNQEQAMTTTRETRHDRRCPQCGRFVENDADGYYDSDDKRDSGQPEMVYGYLAVFCAEPCAARFHGRVSQ